MELTVNEKEKERGECGNGGVYTCMYCVNVNVRYDTI